MTAASSSFGDAPSPSHPAGPPLSRWPGWMLLVWQVGRLARARGAAWKRGAWAGIAFALALFWVNIDGRIGWASGGLGRQGFHHLINLNSWLLVGMVSTFSMAVSREREEGSLDLLRISGLSSVGLLVALGTSQFFTLFFAVLVQIPVVFFYFTLGGLTGREVLYSYGLLIAVAFFVCHVGLWMSVVSRTSRHASQNTIGICLCLYFWPLIFSKIATAFSLSFPSWFTAVLDTVNQANPWNAFQALARTGQFPSTAILFHVGAGLLLLPWAAGCLERNCERREAAGTTRPKVRSRTGGLRPRVSSLAIAWKEYHFAVGGFRWICLRWAIYLVAVLGLTMLYSLDRKGGGFRVSWQPAAWLTVGLLGLLVELPFALTRMLGGEVINRTLGDLCMLPVSFGRLMGEKLLGYLWCIVVPLSILAIGWATYVRAEYSIGEELNWLEISFWVTQALLVMVLTVVFSLAKPNKAFSQALALVICLHLGGWLASNLAGVRPEYSASLVTVLILLTLALVFWLVRRVKWKIEEVAAR